MSGNLNVGNNKILSLGTPSAAGDATPKTYVDLTVANSVSAAPYVKLDGTSAMSGNLNLGSNYAINMLNPIIATDGANKLYVDNAVSSLTTLVNSAVNNLSAASVTVSDCTLIAFPIALTQ
jgi:hypothetical protein